MPADIDDRSATAPHAVVISRNALTSFYAAIPIVKGYFVFADCEGLGETDIENVAFVVRAAELVRW